MNIALLGPSGVGKGTHAENLKATFNLLHVCTGDLFRQNIENKTPLGLQAQQYLREGELVPDEVVDAMIDAHLKIVRPDQGILFDGFPRTLSQATFLQERLGQIGRQLDAVIYLDVSEEEVVKRLSGRLICRHCLVSFHKISRPFQICPGGHCSGEDLYQRPDDYPEMARVRLRLYRRTTRPVLDFFQQQKKLVVLDGEGPIQKVGCNLVEILQTIAQDSGRIGGAIDHQLNRLWKTQESPRPTPLSLQSLDLVLLGAPGSGKGTQAEQLAREFKLEHVATGDLFRDNLKRETSLGKLAKTYMDQGELVPDEITDAMLEERLQRPETAGGFVLDGFPRNVHQAEALAHLMAELGRHVIGVLYIQVPDDQIVGRLSGRWICRNCQAPYHLKFKPPAKEGICDLCGGALYQRDDDNSKTITARLKNFHAQTEPLISFYNREGLLIEVDGSGNPTEVARSTVAAVGKIANQRLPGRISGTHEQASVG